MSEDSNISPYSLIADFDGNVEDIFNIDIDTDTIPVIPLRNMAIFPGIIVPVAIERPFSIAVQPCCRDSADFALQTLQKGKAYTERLFYLCTKKIQKNMTKSLPQ